MEEEKPKEICEELISKSEEKIKEILDKEGITRENIMYLGNTVDVWKDAKQTKYWKEKLEMRYRTNYANYEDSYGRRMRDSRGRYMDGDSYGRRGVAGTGRYRGEEMMEDMHEAYRDYNDNSSYGHDEEGDKAFEYMMEKGVDFVDYLEDEAKTPKQKEMVRKFRQEISKR